MADVSKRKFKVFFQVCAVVLLFFTSQSVMTDDLFPGAEHAGMPVESAEGSGAMKTPSEPGSGRGGSDVVTVMFDDAHFPAYTVDPDNAADESVGGARGGYSDFAAVLEDPQGMSRAGHTFKTENTYEVITLDEGERLTDEKLEEVDVLVIPCSFNEYRTSEIDAIEKYVKGGGGLFLIADHSNFATEMDKIAWRFKVRWAHDVVRDNNDYTGPYDYWIVWEDTPPASNPSDDNMPLNNYPNYEDDPDEVWKITQYASTVQFYASNAYIYENPAESKPVIITDTDGSSNYHGEPAALAIPNGNATGAGKAVFISDSNVFGDMWYDMFGNPDGDCDDDGVKDFWDEKNAEFGLGVIDWLAPDSYEVGLISGEKDPHSGLPKPLVHIYEPGETHTFDIEVWNLGLRSDTIELEIPEVPGNWSAELDKYETSELGTREKEMVRLSVTAPVTNVTDGEYALINVTAKSTYDPENATDKITSTNVIMVDLGFNVNWAVKQDAVTGEKKIEVDPGKTSVVSLGISNTGNINDTYTVSLEGIPREWDVHVDTSDHPEWKYDPDERTVEGITLSSYYFKDNTTGLRVFVTPPMDAEEGETVIMTAMGESYISTLSEQEARGKHHDDLVMEVSAYRTIDMSCEESERYVNPGEAVSFLVAVQNNGNSKENVDIGLGTLPEGWETNVNTPTVILQPRQKKNVRISIRAPEKALEGSRAVLKVEAILPSMHDKVVDSTALTAIVDRFCSINASFADEDYFEVDPGEKISFNLTVNNLGNGNTPLSLSMVELPESWDFRFISGGLAMDSLILEPYSEMTVRVEITISDKVLADAKPSTISLDPYSAVINASGEDNFQHLLASVRVNRKPSLNIFAAKELQISEPASRSMFRIGVKNNGNAWDEVELEIGDVPLDIDPKTAMEKPWKIYFASVSLREQVTGDDNADYLDFSDTVDVGGLSPKTAYVPNNTKEDLLSSQKITLRVPHDRAVWVTTVVEVPPHALAREAGFNITPRSLTDPALRLPVVHCLVEVRNVELLIDSEISLPEVLKPGELVSVMVHIKNIGDIRAENVQVRLSADGELITNMPVRTILAGKSQMVAFTWKVPSKSKCDLRVEVDPDDHIVEKDESNNVKERRVSISSGSGIFSLLGSWNVLLIAGVLGIVLIAILLLVKRKSLG